MVRRRGGQRGLTTLLFTDIVSSTEVAVELGDRRWRSLQARHHAEVRRQLKRHGGHEVDTAGDGFFATFASPAAGVRCAFAIVREVRELGLDIRAGLHIGEAELAARRSPVSPSRPRNASNRRPSPVGGNGPARMPSVGRRSGCN
jgi:class 3 adenylate cyclase